MALNAGEIEDDIQIGDYFIIKKKVFIVLDITDDGYIISPPSRQYQTLRFYRHRYLNENDDQWALINTIPGDKIKDWDYSNYNEPKIDYIIASWDHEGDPYENGDIVLIKSEEVKIDYLQLRDILIDYALRDETDESIPFKKYKVNLSPRMLYGHEHKIVFNTRSLLGATITYMDWLDTEKDEINWFRDDNMWDQQDPNTWSGFVNTDGTVMVEELVEEFLVHTGYLLVELENPRVLGFLFSRQPQIKPIR